MLDLRRLSFVYKALNWCIMVHISRLSSVDKATIQSITYQDFFKMWPQADESRYILAECPL